MSGIFFFWWVGRVLFYVGLRVGKQVTAIISRKTKKIFRPCSPRHNINISYSKFDGGC